MIVEIGEKFGFILKLLMFCFERLQLDSNNLIVEFVDGMIDLSERASCYFLSNFIVLAYYELHCYIIYSKR